MVTTPQWPFQSCMGGLHLTQSLLPSWSSPQSAFESIFDALRSIFNAIFDTIFAILHSIYTVLEQLVETAWSVVSHTLKTTFNVSYVLGTRRMRFSV